MSAPGGGDRAGSGARSNWFGALRILAAAGVLVDHAILLTGHRKPVLLSWSTRTMDLGAVCVAVFFAVSGYLVARSWIAEPDLAAFLRKRALRLWPGLAVLFLLTTFVLGPAVSTLGPLGFLRAPGTRSYLAGITLVPVRYGLPGVFLDNPLQIVNGSLWTLPLEVMAYCLLAIAGTLGLVRRRWPVAAATLVALVLLQTLPILGEDNRWNLPLIFFCGAGLAVYNVPLRATGFLLAGLVLLVSTATGLYLLAPPTLAYVAVYVGTRRTGPLTRAARWGDPSYGIYIYGYPLQQTLVLLGIRGVPQLIAVSAILTALLGYASWYLVERRALVWGRTTGSGSAQIPISALAPSSG